MSKSRRPAAAASTTNFFAAEMNSVLATPGQVRRDFASVVMVGWKEPLWLSSKEGNLVFTPEELCSLNLAIGRESVPSVLQALQGACAKKAEVLGRDNAAGRVAYVTSTRIKGIIEKGFAKEIPSLQLRMRRSN